MFLPYLCVYLHIYSVVILYAVERRNVYVIHRQQRVCILCSQISPWEAPTLITPHERSRRAEDTTPCTDRLVVTRGLDNDGNSSSLPCQAIGQTLGLLASKAARPTHHGQSGPRMGFRKRTDMALILPCLCLSALTARLAHHDMRIHTPRPVFRHQGVVNQRLEFDVDPAPLGVILINSTACKLSLNQEGT